MSWRWLLLACWPACATAATMDELLQQALAATGDEAIEVTLEGPDTDLIRAGVGARQLIGIARREAELAEPGCARYAVTLVADDIELATVRLNLCPGGLPPAPLLVPSPPQ